MENDADKVKSNQLFQIKSDNFELSTQLRCVENSSSDSSRISSSESLSDEDIVHLTPQLNQLIILDNGDDSLTCDSVMISPPEEPLPFFEDLERIENAQFISQYTERQKILSYSTSETVEYQETDVSQSRSDEEEIGPTSDERCEDVNVIQNDMNEDDDEDLKYLTTDSVRTDQIAVTDNETKRDILKHVFQSDSSTNGLVVGDVAVNNSDHVHIGNVTIIKGPVNITQNITTVSQQNITNQLFVNANRVAPKRLNIINRLSWLAQPALEEPQPLPCPPAKYVIISHTATEPGRTQAENILLVRLTQTFHIESRGWNDIAYNFLIGCDGNVYEGRGWNTVGAHTYDYNNKSVGISFIGCFIRNLPPAHSIEACQTLIRTGVEAGHIDENYILLGHCQCSPFESPGKRLFEEIKTWPHWSDIHKEEDQH